jgi:phosphate transport system permease protein
MNRDTKKKIEALFFRVLMYLAVLVIVAVIVLVMVVVLIKGGRAMSWQMITEVPQGGFYLGGDGGILNAIIGSLYVAGGSVLLAVLIGLPLVLGMHVSWARNTRLVTFLRFLLDTLWGIPSIVYGAFGFALMTFFQWRASLLAAIVTVALLIVPIISRGLDEVLRGVPEGLLEAAHALGATKTEIAYRIFLRQALPGFITAVLLAFGRAIGDTASVLFTAGYTDNIPQALSDPTATLPLAIFFQLSSPIAAVQERAYAATLILTGLIVLISLVTRIGSRRLKENIL